MPLTEEDIREVNRALADAIVAAALVPNEEDTPEQSDEMVFIKFKQILEEIARAYENEFNKPAESESSKKGEPQLSGGRRTRKVGGNPLLRTMAHFIGKFPKHTMRNGVRGFATAVKSGIAPISQFVPPPSGPITHHNIQVIQDEYAAIKTNKQQKNK